MYQKSGMKTQDLYVVHTQKSIYIAICLYSVYQSITKLRGMGVDVVYACVLGGRWGSSEKCEA